MRVNDQLYVVGGGDSGFNLSGALDANCYVVDAGDELWMIDAGFDGGEQVVANLKADAADPRGVGRLFVTHYHADHIGALSFMRTALSPSLQVAVAADVADRVRSGDEEDNGFRWAKSVGYYPPDFHLKPCEVDIELASGQTFAGRDLQLQVIATPGHCRGHLCFLVTGEGVSFLFCGDQVFWGGKVNLQNVADASVQEYAASMNRLLDYEFDALLPGHSGFSLQNGRRHVELAASQFNRIGLPANLF
jgi:hydroxyacylglutathione hydrolase